MSTSIVLPPDHVAPQMPTPDKILRLPEVIKQTGLGKATIYRKIARNEFPRPVRLGERAVGWKATGIDSWIGSL